MSRYTARKLTNDAALANIELRVLGIKVAYQVGARNGYTAIDIQEDEAIGRSIVTRGLVNGSPRECLDAMTDHKNALLLDYWKSTAMARETITKKNNMRITMLEQQHDEIEKAFNGKVEENYFLKKATSRRCHAAAAVSAFLLNHPSRDNVDALHDTDALGYHKLWLVAADMGKALSDTLDNTPDGDLVALAERVSDIWISWALGRCGNSEIRTDYFNIAGEAIKLASGQ